jgi:hypothetical protein
MCHEPHEVDEYRPSTPCHVLIGNRAPPPYPVECHRRPIVPDSVHFRFRLPARIIRQRCSAEIHGPCEPILSHHYHPVLVRWET